MSIARRLATVAAFSAAAAAFLLIPTQASAHPGHDPNPGQESPVGPSKGDPIAGPDFFAGHLERYHFGQTLIGFDRAASDPYDWAAYHFLPTNLETVTRAVSPAKAPEAKGDTWAETPAPEAEPGHGHGPPSHAGQPLHAPVNPTAGVDYLAKWGQQAKPAELVPAAQETVRRTVTPTEAHPPNTVDKWSDKRPTKDSAAAPTVLPATVAKIPAEASATGGRFVNGAIKTAAGTTGSGEQVLPVGGLLNKE